MKLMLRSANKDHLNFGPTACCAKISPVHGKNPIARRAHQRPSNIFAGIPFGCQRPAVIGGRKTMNSLNKPRVSVVITWTQKCPYLAIR
jgi:hypothetical protein